MEYQAIAVRSQNRENGSSSLAADGSVAMTLRYIGSDASATVTVASGDITLKSGVAGSEVVDPTVGASGVVADGTYTTIGAMVDCINLSPNWKAEIVDCLRSDTSTNAMKALSEYTFSPKTQVVSLYADSSVTLNLSYRISARRTNVNKSMVGKQAFFVAADVLADVGSAGLLNVYEISPAGVIINTLGTWAVTDNTAETKSIVSGLGQLFGGVGNPLLVRLSGTSSFSDTGLYLRTAGFIQ